MGVSTFKTIQKLYDEKIHCYEQPRNKYMQRGLDLEIIALREFEKETGLIMFPVVGVSDEIDWMAASFDGMTIEGDAIVEIKAPGKKDHSTALKGKIPEKYYPQLQHQIYVSGLQMAYYYSFDGEKGIVLKVKRDDVYIDNMIQKLFEFWQLIQAQQDKKEPVYACSADVF
jgi:putative phage-type endonuclease